MSFFDDYKPRYSRYWAERIGSIPSLPTSIDNANSIYELLAWNQRAVKQIMNDFIALNIEFDEYKDGLLELIEVILPSLFREYAISEEFKKAIYEINVDWYEKSNQRLKEIETVIESYKPFEEAINKSSANEKKIQDLQTSYNNLSKSLNDLKNQPTGKKLASKTETYTLGIQQSNGARNVGSMYVLNKQIPKFMYIDFITSNGIVIGGGMVSLELLNQNGKYVGFNQVINSSGALKGFAQIQIRVVKSESSYVIILNALDLSTGEPTYNNVIGSSGEKLQSVRAELIYEEA